MIHNKQPLSTGMPGLDLVLSNLRAGDNVVWEVDSVAEYEPFLMPLVKEAARLGRPMIYFRFARHAPLLNAADGVTIHQLDTQEGFERFLTGIIDIIEEAGPGAFYIFDCLSDLAADWFSDRMLGNFFMIACPRLYELDTIAYFALQKNLHSSHATDAIFSTAQIVIEVYRKYEQFFIKPLKVWQRTSPTMYTLHSWEGDTFTPVTNSATITDIFASVPQPWLEFTILRPGIWGETFQRALQLVNEFRRQTPVLPSAEAEAHILTQRLITMVVSRDKRMAALASQHLILEDVVEIMQRMVGTGLIGGKSLGMLLARAILKKSDLKWSTLLEGHDSFYVGSDVFYTYLVQNGCWWLHTQQKDFPTQLDRAAAARQKIQNGTFPKEIEHQFLEMLEYFGQSPLIVRSSSLLEDNYGNAFSGKYESVFLANQGSPQERLVAFLDAVRIVYSSAMSTEALLYRQQHGLLDSDEQMALLVQRVSGQQRAELFFPQLAGVGFSFNPFCWHEDIDPQAGVLRLVFGLGTRAVNRADDDYTRLVALNQPLKRPEAKSGRGRNYAQRRVDLLDLRANALVSQPFEDIAPLLPEPLAEFFTDGPVPVPAGQFVSLNLDKLLAESDFVPTMRDLCRTLQHAYEYPVDIEFTVNFTGPNHYRINLVQCRPFQVKIGGQGSLAAIPETIAPENLFLRTRGPIIGHSLAAKIDRLIYVVPAAYSKLSMSQRGDVARAIGQLTRLTPPGYGKIMLAGPGRWGTSMPALGVPVTLAEINTVSVICELAVMHEGLVPDVSLGTHFFNDLVELDMLYLAVSPGRPDNELNESFVCRLPNQLTQLLPAAAALAPVLWVVDPANLQINIDSMKQTGVCYFAVQKT
jgi:hypothetical protein